MVIGCRLISVHIVSCLFYKIKSLCARQCIDMVMNNCTNETPSRKGIWWQWLLLMVKLKVTWDNRVVCNWNPFLNQVTKCFFESGYLDTRVYFLSDLAAGHMIEGPAIIIDQNRYWNVCSTSYDGWIQVLYIGLILLEGSWNRLT